MKNLIDYYMNNWIILSVIYGLLCGTSDLLKKQVLKKVSVIQTLVLFNFVVLIILIISGGNYAIDISNFGFIMLKCLCMFWGWLISYKVICEIQISYYSIIMLSKVIFSGILSVIFLNEEIKANKVFGFIIIAVGIIVVNLNIKQKNKIALKNILLTLISAFLISASLFLDKIILKNISEFSLQFYYTFILTIMFLVYLVLINEKLNFKNLIAFPEISSLAIVTYLADLTHFIAAADSNSSVVVMTLLRHSSLIVTVFIGSIIFKEQQILLKIFATIIVVIGLIITVL